MIEPSSSPIISTEKIGIEVLQLANFCSVIL